MLQIQQKCCKFRKICKILPNFKKCQLDNLVDFEKCCKKRIFLQNRCRYSRKRATYCRNLSKTGNYPPMESPGSARSEKSGKVGSTCPGGVQGSEHDSERFCRKCCQISSTFCPFYAVSGPISTNDYKWIFILQIKNCKTF